MNYVQGAGSRWAPRRLHGKRGADRAMGQTVKKVWNAATTIVVAAAVLAALAMAGARLAGLRVFTVLSGSMEPEYPVGALLYVKPADCQTLQCGDVITFLLAEDTVATHRIVEVLPDENDPAVVRFRTKGDANAAEDGALVHCNNVIGTPVLTIPLLGYFVEWVRRPPGLYAALGVVAVLVLLAFLPDLAALVRGDPKKD